MGTRKEWMRWGCSASGDVSSFEPEAEGEDWRYPSKSLRKVICEGEMASSSL